MSKLNQKEATYQAIINVCGVHDGPYNPTKEQRAQVNAILVAGFMAGSIELERSFTESELKAYVSGLQSNWLRKDKRLNGGIKYEAKNPGSRAGMGDAQLREMKKLLSTVTDPADKAEIEECIKARQAELNESKQKVVVNFAALPESLRSKFQK
jgi:hypothetical protein